jgi:hypothetical protein
MRSSPEVRDFVTKALGSRWGAIRFYEVFDSPDSFAFR